MSSPFRSPRNPVLFIAEIGGNHEGNVDYLRRLTRLAVDSGADYVKYQLYRGDTLVSAVEGPDRNAHFKRFEVSLDVYDEEMAACRRANVGPMASTWDLSMIEWVNERTDIHKVGSGDLTCFPVLRALAATGKPIILSTGMATLDEVSAAVDYIAGIDRSYVEQRRLAILQCTSAYPCPDSDANLLAMDTLRRRFGLPVGYSDHTEGSLAVEAAVALGAEIIEKHFTDSRDGKVFRDHKVSLTRDEIRELLGRLARISAFRGTGDIKPTDSEMKDDHPRTFRRSVYMAADAPARAVLTDAMLTVLRPAHGISAARYDEVIGRTLRVAKRRHEVITDDEIE